SAFSQQYTATGLEVTPTIDQLQAAPPADPSVDNALYQWLKLPDGVREQLAPLAESVAGAETTDYDRALALQNWFRTDFTYSLDTVEGNATEALDTFLRDRSGYCEQFAATMALMARTLDIPSRVQVGFTPGEQNEDGTWVVTVHDAHAWPELWFEGVGWVRFEPTPGGGDGGATPGWAPTPADPTRPGQAGQNDNNGGGVVIRRGGGPVGERGGRPADLREVLRANRSGNGLASESTAAGGEQGDGSPVLLWLALIAVAGAAAGAPKAASLVVRRTRWRRVATTDLAISAAWADVLDAATDVDLRPAPTETPRDLARRLPARGGLSPGRAAALGRLAGWVELLRYRGGVEATMTVADIRQLADDIRRDLFAAISPRDRRRARWWPTSGRIALVNGWNGAADATADRWQRWTPRRSRQEASTGLTSQRG
ncbi:MAG: transglutaminase domain-containing protein, partial [Actinomycetia bacterium]|nr:transglutaminase domain-containing protein [Actinomycetes bacterium]